MPGKTIKAKKYGFQLQFAKAFRYVFKTPTDRNKAIREIKSCLRKSSLTRADYHIAIKKSIQTGRGMRVLKGGKHA